MMSAVSLVFPLVWARAILNLYLPLAIKWATGTGHLGVTNGSNRNVFSPIIETTFYKKAFEYQRSMNHEVRFYQISRIHHFNNTISQ